MDFHLINERLNAATNGEVQLVKIKGNTTGTLVLGGQYSICLNGNEGSGFFVSSRLDQIEQKVQEIIANWNR